MMVINVHNVTKMYGAKTILEDVCFQTDEGERVGLVGPNGAGKSTLLKILTGREEADKGTVSLKEGIETGYLPQTTEYVEGETIEEWIKSAQSEFLAMERRMGELTQQMKSLRGEELARVLAEYGQVGTRFEERGGYDLKRRTELVMQGLGVARLNRTRRFATLSGGEKSRLSLACLLIRTPELLLLDEPTNHLDLDMMVWLEQYLGQYTGTLLVVSHERQFLNQTVTGILEVDEYDHRVRKYAGNYDMYLEQKRVERRQWEERYLQQQEEIRQLQKRISEAPRQVGHNRPPRDKNKMAYNGHGQKVEKVVARNILSAKVQLERILADPLSKPPRPLAFRAGLDTGHIDNPIAVSVSHLYVFGDGGKPLLKGIGFTLDRKERMLITGPNGAGKTTLLNVIAGVRKADEGEVFLPASLTLGYLEQEFRCPDPLMTVLDFFRQGLAGGLKEHIAELLSYRLFRYGEFQLSVGHLSPGQRRKLMLARLLAARANLLLLDEPTNHVSFDILEELEQALDEFPGPVIAVSHDRRFISRFRGSIWTMEEGILSPPDMPALTQADEERMVREIEELASMPVDPPGRRA